MKRKMRIGIQSTDEHPRVSFCSHGEEANMKMIVHVAITDAIENDHKSVMILTFALFFSLCFPHYLGASRNRHIWT